MTTNCDILCISALSKVLMFSLDSLKCLSLLAINCLVHPEITLLEADLVYM